MHDAGDTGRARAETPPIPSRRAVLAGSTAAPLAGAAVVTTAHAAPIAPPGGAGDDTELLRACRDFLAADCRVKETDAEHWEDDAAADALNTVWYNALERLTALPARTTAGMQAKAHAAYLALASTLREDMQSMEREEWAALSALADLAGSAAA